MTNALETAYLKTGSRYDWLAVPSDGHYAGGANGVIAAEAAKLFRAAENSRSKIAGRRKRYSAALAICRSSVTAIRGRKSGRPMHSISVTSSAASVTVSPWSR